MAVNLAKNQQEISSAWKAVSQNKEHQKWALFGYEPNSNNITLMSTGNNGLKELVNELNCSMIQYALCRVIEQSSDINKLILINWQGESAPLTRKGLCASHVSDVANYFQGCSHTITIRNEDEATEEHIIDLVRKNSSRISFRKSNDIVPENNSFSNKNDKVLSNSNKPKANIDLTAELAQNRKSFWAQQEAEEKKRVDDEKKKALEKQAQFDKERKLREDAESKKLAETIKLRDQAIEATRQAEKDQFASKISAKTKENISDEDDRFGRRSELLRHERSQETNSLISRGTIKNKRAIFEQTSSQAPNQVSGQTAATLNRRSGSIITDRLNKFQSLSSSASPSSSNSDKSISVEYQNESTQSNKKVEVESIQKPVEAVSKTFDTIQIVNDEPSGLCSATNSDLSNSKSPEAVINGNSAFSNGTSPKENTASHNVNDNEESPKKASNLNGEQESSKVTNGHDEPQEKPILDNNVNVCENLNGICAKALFDYEAADNTEISFDPSDIIGHINKVDEGWWHGTVLTGQFAGMAGLFPSNYVEEI